MQVDLTKEQVEILLQIVNRTQFAGADAGHTIDTDVDFAKYKAIQMACDNGTSFPASPNTGQWFYRTDIKTLFIYEAAWKSIISFDGWEEYIPEDLM